MRGIIVNWINSLASIPSGWNLCDGNGGRPNLLDKYLKSVGASEDPGSTGGSSTHNHTSSSHNHTQNSHSHSVTTGNSDAARHASGVAASAGPYHAHTVDLASTTATNQSTSLTLDSTSNDPPHYKVAFIYDGADNRYPIGSIVYWNSATAPTGWTICDGNGGTPDLRNRYLKCVGAAEDPGATGGSSNAHTHTNSHSHTQVSHSHTTTHGVASSINGGVQFTSATYASNYSHTHTLSSTGVVATNQDTSVTIDTINGEPIFKKILLVQNTTVLANRPKYGIVVWSGTIANIPYGYVLCDGNNGTPDLRDYFIKGALNSSELGSTGGSSTHIHTAQSHNHTQSSHAHGVTMGTAPERHMESVSDMCASDTHTHSCSDATGTATNQSANITIDSTSSIPSHYEVAYVMQDRELDIGGGALLMFL